MGKRYKMLIVDDQWGIRKLLIETFRDHYHVEEAQNGFEALEKTEKYLPDVIILDMRMPGMDGLETIKKIRAINKYVPIILMTAYDSEELIKVLQNMHAVEYISKPFDIDVIREKVLLLESQILNQVSVK